MVWVVPEHVACTTVSGTGTSGAAREDADDCAGIYLSRRAQDDPDRGRQKRAGDGSARDGWVANERLARVVAVENLRSIKQAARYGHGLDGSPAPIALTKES
jgi:hypothetical protein